MTAAGQRLVVPVGIAGLGMYAPEGRITNYDLEKMVDTSDEWIVQRTGIRERRQVGEGEYSSDLATKASLQALDQAGMRPEEIDLIICCTVTGDHHFPATACVVAEKLGAINAGAWDLGGACSGFISGAQAGAQFVGTGANKTVLVIGVESLTRILDYQDRNTCVLFGDGAGAIILTSHARAGRLEYLGGSMGLTPDREAIIQPAGGTRMRPTPEVLAQREQFLKMGGKKVYRFAVKTFARLVQTALEPYGYGQLGLVVPHQVNQRIIEAAAERLDLPIDLFYSNIEKYGNTSAASVPMALREADDEGRLEPGKILCSVAFGAGLSWGHLLFRI